ncbi:MAG TPA: hypothetical protein PLI83_11310, partial [Thermomonas sp.]|nr:hypothetical protein [Thermomonas sp.]
TRLDGVPAHLEGLIEQLDRAAARGIHLPKSVYPLLIAQARGTSEKTARVQSSAIYAKSGLAGRSELSAFFLEDLLPPRVTPPDDAPGDPQPR